MPEEYAGFKFVVERQVKQPLPPDALRIGREIEWACKRIAHAGFAHGIGGNLSQKHGKGFVITPTGVGLANMNAGDMSLVTDVDFGANSVKKCIGMQVPSSEALMHALIYAERTEAKAIAHMHVEVLLDETGASAVDVPTTPQVLPYGTRESAKAACDLLAQADVIVMKGHGTVAVGANIGDAVAKIINKYRAVIRK
ncbi:MAG: class II aldolase/adducin family protein [Candidatus Micrarchaeia archaeon]